MVEAEALQAGGDLIHDVTSRDADGVRAPPHSAAHFRCNDHVLAFHLFAQRLPELNLRLGLGIDIGGVEEIDPRFDGAADEPSGGGLIECADRAPPLNVIVPRQISETNWPVRPSGR